MVYVRSIDGEPTYDRGRRYYPQSDYTPSEAGSEYYYDERGSRRNYGRSAATRFNPYSYGGAAGAYDTYGSHRSLDRRPEVRTYTLDQASGIERLRAASARGYQQRYYEDDARLMQDRRMMGDPYLSRSAYPRFLVPGWAHILIGVFILIIGLADVGYTASEFEGDCSYTGSDFDPGPCESNNVYTYVASPVWGGIFMIMTGAMTFWMTEYRLRYNDWLLKAFCGLAIFLGLAICPAIIVLNILEITQNENTFWKEGDGITLQDEAKFALVVVVILLAFVDWLLAILSVCICICCPPRELTFEKRPKFMPEAFADPYARAPRPREPVVIHEEVIQPSRRGEPSRAFSDVMSRSEVIPRAAVTSGRERGPVVVYEERIPGGSRRGDDDVYTVHSEGSYYSRGGRRGRTYDNARSEDYGRSYYY